MVESGENDKAKLNWSKIRNAVFGANRHSLNRLKLLLLESGEHDPHQERVTTVYTHGKYR